MENTIKFSIPKPCHEDWNEMTTEERGRFCSVCSKTVIDFTSSNNQQIQEYLSQNKEQSVCGRFKNEQLDSSFTFSIPQSVLYQKRSFHKAFLLALFVTMGATLFSCKNSNNQTMGEVAVVNDTVLSQTDSLYSGDPVKVGKVKYDPSGPKRVPPPPKPRVDEEKFLKQEEMPTIGIIVSESDKDSTNVK